MYTDRGHDDGDYPRVCDGCGHRFMFKQLVYKGELRWECPDCAPGLTKLQIARYNARVKPVIVRPRKHAKDYIQTPVYQFAEGQIFNFISQVAPAETRDGDIRPETAAWAAIYMADVILDARRPRLWDRTARTTMDRCLAYLLTQQYGSPTGISPAGTIDNPRYGGIYDEQNFNYPTVETCLAGVAFLKAYAITADTGYLQAAERIGTFIRHVQSGHVQATQFTVFPMGAGAYYVGGLAFDVSDIFGSLSNGYHLNAVIGLWFLKLLRDVKGGSTAYGDTAATGSFGANSASLDTMISDLTTFATVGPRDETNGNATTPGLSTTSPKQIYVAATDGGGQQAAWQSASSVTSVSIASALLGLYIANGSSALVTSILAWLQSFTSNTANQTPTGQHPDVTIANNTGTYDPTLCPATFLKATATFTEATGASYAWDSLGLLAPLIAPTDAADFTRGKNAVSTARRHSNATVTVKFLGLSGRSGLSFQPTGTESVTRAAMAGMVYRQAPGHYITIRGN